MSSKNIKTIKDERRKSQRLKIPLKIHCKWSQKTKVLQEILSQDISGGGMRIKTSKPLKEGFHLKTLLYFPNASKPVHVTSEVVWCKRKKKAGNIYYDVGVKHLRIAKADRQRFVFLFCETMLNYFLFAQNK